MDGQRAAGMVNNRVFEALATGAPLVMETFPELEALFADLPEDGGASHLLLWREPGDVAKRVDALRRTADLGARTRRYMAERHTYDARAARVLAFFARVRAAKQKRCARHGCLRVAVVWSGEWTPQFGSSFGAAADLLADPYHLNWIAREPHDLLVYDAVWAVGPLGGAADLRARRLTRDFTTARRLHQRRLLVLLDDAARPAPGPGVRRTATSSARRALPGGADLRLVGNDAAARGGDLRRLVEGARALYIPHAANASTGDWAAVFAAAYGAQGAAVRVEPGNARAILAADAHAWDDAHFAAQISFAMTRALTLGRAASSAAILAPADGARRVARRRAADLVFDLAIDAFNVGREGSWCLVASVGGMLTCVLQNHLTLVLRVEPPDGCDLDVAFRVELKSNVYGDVFLVWPYRPGCPD
ncbi:glycosyl transferase [Aureococcus anophagefferens]|nr:glycosyl transferase [Aureococcus anophagefferens]